MFAQPNGQVAQEKISAATFAAKYKSKLEIFNFLSVTAGTYLCPYECVTIYFLKDLVSGKKKFIKCGEVAYLFVPQYKTLSIDLILKKAKDFPRVLEFLPDEVDQHRLPRQWVINVINTLVGEPFKRWVDQNMENRNERLAAKHDLMIEMDPEIARAFRCSTHISTSKGNGAHLLKIGSKRRRTQTDLEERDVEIVLREELSQQQEDQIALLNHQLQQATQEAQNNRAASEILSQMIQRGQARVNSQGEVELCYMPNDISSLIEQ